MLRMRSIITALLLVAAFAAVTPTAAHADPWGDTKCPPGTQKPECTVQVGTGGSGGSKTGGNNGSGTCHNPQGTVIPCERDGGWAGSDGCYYTPIDNLPPETIANLGGQPAGEGGWYQKECYDDQGNVHQGFGGPVWVAGAPPVVSPEVLARQARAKLQLPDVVIKLNPPGAQLVNLPVWLSLDPSSWASKSATAAVPGYSVTATATPVHATWSMGDGGSVGCAGPGTAWTPGTDPTASSPDCGYVYRNSSAGASGGKFAITVTVTWQVTWAGAGRAGTIPGLTTTATLGVQVQESQAVLAN